MTLLEQWPLFGLRLVTGDLELRLPTDEDLAALAEVAAGGIHAPEATPLPAPWTDRPAGELQQSFLQYHWRTRAEWSPEEWDLSLAVIHGGEPVGVQSVSASQFAVVRSVTTGSWLGSTFQAQGIGRRMRTAVLALVFDHLDALEARSSAFAQSPGSRGVSEILGYREDGTEFVAARDEALTCIRFVMELDVWRAQPPHDVEVFGLEPCREMFGV